MHPYFIPPSYIKTLFSAGCGVFSRVISWLSAGALLSLSLSLLLSLLAGLVWLTAPQEQTGTLAEGSGVCMHNPLNMSLLLEPQLVYISTRQKFVRRN